MKPIFDEWSGPITGAICFAIAAIFFFWLNWRLALEMVLTVGGLGIGVVLILFAVAYIRGAAAKWREGK